jgi:hypothetical protein
MHIINKNGDKTQQQASTRYVLMTGTLAVDFRAARQICCLLQGAVARSATSTTNFFEQDSCSCYFGSGIEADACLRFIT